MKVFVSVIAILLITLAGLVYFRVQEKNTSVTSLPLQTSLKEAFQTGTTLTAIVAENLNTPWAIAFLPDSSMLVTERSGQIRLIDPSGKLEPSPIATIESSRETGEGGLLGIALHPDFSQNKFVYLYYTYSSNSDNTLNRVVRMKYSDKKLTEEEIIIDKIPGAANHNGGRIKFGPDKFLYTTAGDAQNPSLAQDKTSLAGKILRTTDNGKLAIGNPFGNLVYSYGHRNTQGLAWDSNGVLWATEHGRSGTLSGLDEINLIEVGRNYGWPQIQGDERQTGMESPRRHSGHSTWAPAGAAFIGSSLFFGGLRGEALFEATIEDGQVISIKEHFKGEFGRIRDVSTGPDGLLYITTSNKDGRGSIKPNDDKIIKIDPKQL